MSYKCPFTNNFILCDFGYAKINLFIWLDKLIDKDIIYFKKT